MDDNTLANAMQAKQDEAQKLLEHFRQMHQMMHDEMDKKKEEAPMVRLQSQNIPS